MRTTKTGVERAPKGFCQELANHAAFVQMVRERRTIQELEAWVGQLSSRPVHRGTIYKAVRQVELRERGELLPPAPAGIDQSVPKVSRLPVDAGPIARETAAPPLPPDPQLDEVEQTFAGEEMVLRMPKTAIKTMAELVEHCKVDLSVWEPVQIQTKAWNGFIKNAEERIEVVQLFAVRATFRKLKNVDTARRVIADLLADAKGQMPVYPRVAYQRRRKAGHLLELALFDAHVGKLCWEAETGDKYDLDEAGRLFLESVEGLLELTAGYEVSRILMPIGNDFFNSEGMRRSTTAGTPQEDACRWQTSFTYGRRLVTQAIERAREVAPVDVVIVPGNHDFERCYYLGEVLEVQFTNAKEVAVDNAPKPRKFHAYGKNLIMFTHGNEEAPRDLPLIMASAEPRLWAESAFREIHSGHFHKKKETRFVGVDEHQGVVWRILPSLSGTDAWHQLKGYKSQRAAQALVFDPEAGNVGTFTHNVL